MPEVEGKRTTSLKVIFEPLSSFRDKFFFYMHTWSMMSRTKLGVYRHWIVIFYLEPGAYLRHHVIVQIKSIVGYDSFRKSISTYNFPFDELSHHWFCHTGIRHCFYPLGKVINDHEDETMAIRGLWGYRPNHIHVPQIGRASCRERV